MHGEWRIASSDLALRNVVLDAEKYLTADVLASLGLEPFQYWKRNPYLFDRAILCAALVAETCRLSPAHGRRRLVSNGRSTGFRARSPAPKQCRTWQASTCVVASLMPVYRRFASAETDRFAQPRARLAARLFDFGLGYVLKVQPGFPWTFTLPPQHFIDSWTAYARPCSNRLSRGRSFPTAARSGR